MVKQGQLSPDDLPRPLKYFKIIVFIGHLCEKNIGEKSTQNYCLCIKKWPDGPFVHLIVVSIGHFHAFHVVFVPMKYIPTIPPMLL